MKIEYFTDADTLLIELSTKEIVETRDLNENTLVEFDSTGTLVNMTIEHAKEQANMEEFVFHSGKSTEHDMYKITKEPPKYNPKGNE